MKKQWLFFAAFLMASMAHANEVALTVYQDPNCGCCAGWAEHMRQSGFEVKQVKTREMVSVKEQLGVPTQLGSCHTAVMKGTGQVVEGHVPASVVRKLLADPLMKGVAAPGMPTNAPGMGELNGNLVTVDFQGRPFSRD
ncbi:MAG: CopG family transcriptional regulator [Pusillimonas sp.]|nr:CopG family transcriptional regulator [Pusillimonas sp.]